VHHADHETDAHIQESLKTQLGNDVTVLIVAHRLRTIADANKIVSCACPERATALIFVFAACTRCWSTGILSRSVPERHQLMSYADRVR
jgi:hypothetical protein